MRVDHGCFSDVRLTEVLIFGIVIRNSRLAKNDSAQKLLSRPPEMREYIIPPSSGTTRPVQYWIPYTALFILLYCCFSTNEEMKVISEMLLNTFAQLTMVTEQ